MSPELLNKAFSTKSTQCENSIESLMTPGFRRKTSYVAVSVVIDTQTHTHTHRTITVTLAHALRVKYALISQYALKS